MSVGCTDRRCLSQSNKVSKYTAGHLQFNPSLYIHSKISLLLLAAIREKKWRICLRSIFSFRRELSKNFYPKLSNTWNVATDLTDQPYRSLFCRGKSWTCFHYIQHRLFQAVGDVSFGAVVSSPCSEYTFINSKVIRIHCTSVIFICFFFTPQLMLDISIKIMKSCHSGY